MICKDKLYNIKKKKKIRRLNMRYKIYTVENLRDETEALTVDNDGKWNWVVVKYKKNKGYLD